MLRGFHPCHIGTLDFCAAPRWIFFSGCIFWSPFFGGIYSSYCRKTHTENSGKNSVEKFCETIPSFGALFGAFFGTFFGEQLFASKSEKFVQNPFCKRDPLILLHKLLEHPRGPVYPGEIPRTSRQNPRDMPAKSPGHSRFSSSKPKKNKLSREGTIFLTTTPLSGGSPPHPAGSGPKMSIFLLIFLA